MCCCLSELPKCFNLTDKWREKTLRTKASTDYYVLRTFCSNSFSKSIFWQLFPLPPTLHSYAELPMKLVVYSVQTWFPSPKVWWLTFVLLERGIGHKGWERVEWASMRNPSRSTFSPLPSLGFVPLPSAQSQKIRVASSHGQDTPTETCGRGETIRISRTDRSLYTLTFSVSYELNLDQLN